ncbi:nucleoside triphosphate pyrophosphohydrolase [Alteromonas flava]|uniref:nucleoside triphosphate pyrophosphohydrolase n=1 Tax=Alteromonas flava TaxID=2048003 RepID=UPI000C290C50|nr:nucleoside triphosphate pyrophosphohydrolase [Alteromonas flava]
MTEKPENLTRLLQIMQQLRDPINGCPWDRKQNMTSLLKYTLEETYEVADAILRAEPTAICDELGDLLFQVVFYAQIAHEQGQFSFDDVAKAIADKLIRRHPHVFEDSTVVHTDEELAAQWEAIKATERQLTKETQSSILDRVKRGVPAFQRAYELQDACAKVGFDWDSIGPVLAKVEEEVTELRSELNASTLDKEAAEEELGDLLFAVVNLARHMKVSPELALTKACQKFEGRFNYIETAIQEQDKQIHAVSLEEMEALWEEAKQRHKE